MSPFQDMTTAEKLQAQRYLLDKAVGHLSHAKAALSDRVLGQPEELATSPHYRLGYSDSLVGAAMADLEKLASLIDTAR